VCVCVRGHTASTNGCGLRDLAKAVLGANTAENFAFLENTLIRILAAESARLFLGAKVALAVPLHAQQLGTFVAQPGHLGPWTDHAESAADTINDPEETLYVRISYMLLYPRCRRACTLSGALLSTGNRPCQGSGSVGLVALQGTAQGAQGTLEDVANTLTEPGVVGTRESHQGIFQAAASGPPFTMSVEPNFSSAAILATAEVWGLPMVQSL
jgi:hypothetical protein